MSTWICIHCSFWSIASLCAQKADCTERWLRFTSREVAHYYFAPNMRRRMEASSSGAWGPRAPGRRITTATETSS
ncbi:hypothetical protein A8F26_11925 [Burkholderia cenocepacia]|nr:hypothetical protein A8F16_27580 [Burkholderia cenocepacia]ONX69996.1 hypothetical protein A8F17_10470 [Burkholderia cenocepacia]ONX73901.1 hypothetical protein A8F14_14085 [Burkholderia cenocepacia]ONX91448.1 hypothetical protein A8F19_10740 [Burkholderia cenocepacia]ONX93125.1 hypothetical protein A8F20_34290 [Burkholderia cenocepacia]